MSKIISQSLTFDDVLLVPGWSTILPKQTNVTGRFSRNIELKCPLVSSPMDTVTEKEMAIKMAQLGGIGVIHKGMSIEEQVKHVSAVKKHEYNIIREPHTVFDDMTLAEVKEKIKVHNVTTFPVIKRGTDNLVGGILTSRDMKYKNGDLSTPVSKMMTPFARTMFSFEDSTPDEMLELCYFYKVEQVLILNKEYELRGMMTVKDAEHNKEYPNATKDSSGRLMVAAAIGTDSNTMSRVWALIESEVDAIVIDTAHAHSERVYDIFKSIKNNFKEIDVVVGNLVTPSAVKMYRETADGLRVGIGSGSICSTRIISGVGYPQLSAILACVDAAEEYNIPIIADGGIRYSGDVAKALAAGASSVMCGGMLAGCDETPGVTEHHSGRMYKSYRGMGSIGAMTSKDGSADRYGQDSNDKEKLVPEGIEGRVPYRGKTSDVVYQIIGGLRSAMGYTGCKNLKDFRDNTKFTQITSASYAESHVHDVVVTKEAPNYWL
jgi:IMP dehydrogenase